MEVVIQTETTAPKVSIVLPCYNRERYLGIAVQSVIEQTYTDWELIISDDGSTDGSLEIAQNFAQHDPRIRVLTNPNRPKNDKHRGAVNALIAGFDAARGEYVGQLDSDDRLEPPAVELTVAALEANPDWGIVYTNYIDIDENGKKLRPGWRCSYPYSKEALLTVCMTFHFRLIRKSAYQKVNGFDSKMDKMEDYDLCLRLSEETEIGKVNEFLYQYRRHDDALTYPNTLPIIMLATKAVKKALVRRGMSETHRLRVEFNPKLTIEKT